MNDFAELVEEFSRVFGTIDIDWDRGRIGATGWPEMVAYDVDRAIEVLRGFDDSYGQSEAGDAEICDALDAVSALI